MKTPRVLLLIGLLGTAAAPMAALADAPRYDFLDVAYQTFNDPSGSGYSSDHAYSLSGSYAFTDQFLGGASYGHESADLSAFGFKGSASANVYSLGVGYHFPLASNLDLVPNLSYVSAHSS